MNTGPDPSSTLHPPGSYLTRQRQLVLDILKELPGHPDAGAIFQAAKQHDDRISLATVYRALAWLKEAGLIEENHLGEDHGHFESLQKPGHYHFTCLNCGQVIEFEDPSIPALAHSISKRENLQVTAISFHLQGYCPACQADRSRFTEGIKAEQPASMLPDLGRGGGGVPVPLSDLTPGKAGLISRLEGGKEFVNRVASLGFTIGARVTVLQNHGRQGPMIVSMLGAHIALGRFEADLIQVQPL